MGAERVEEAIELEGATGEEDAGEDTDPVQEAGRMDPHATPDDGPGMAGVPALPPGTVAYRSGMTLEDMERDVIAAVLDSVEWNRRQAAEILGIGERTLYRKVRKYGLEEEVVRNI
ncbi:MAG: hypothetical protein F4X60_07750 [Gemmatimonadetes bacterium]|nr:hypothetical protein [Gemmatimonadota bacterium]